MNLPKCPVETAMMFLGDEKKTLIISYLLRGSLRPGEIYRKMGGISRTSMTNKLKDLERQGIIERKAFEEIPPKVEYSLTEMGRSMENIISEIDQWGQMHKKTNEVFRQ